jgi:serine/threonine-protein kinase
MRAGADSLAEAREPVQRNTRIRSRTPLRFMAELGEGSPVGEYEIQAQIGEGAMGTVYSAIHPLIGKTVAIKVLKAELCANQNSVDRFVQEAMAVNQIGHPNIVDVFSLGELPDGRAYFVMEWLRGEDLKVRLARGPISLPDACDILDGIARALEAAHAKDVVHRDLKPDNVFLHQLESGPAVAGTLAPAPMVKLLDFGIAKLMRAKAKIEKTQTGNMLGTPRYISPEQARGIDVTHRSDIYSLGVMAYEMLAGRPPFHGETAMDLVVKHLNEPPPALSQFARIPRSLEQCVMGMLAKDPADRPSLETIRHILVDPTQRITQVRRAPRRAGWIGAAVAAVIVLGLAVVTWQVMRTGSPPDVTAAAIAPPSPPALAPPAAEPPPVTEPPPPGTSGTLDISVTGARDATILVDGVEWGRGASIRVQLDPGPHDLEARVRGRDPILQHVEVAAGQRSAATLVVPPRTAPPHPTHPPRKQPSTQSKQRDEDSLLKPKGVR